VSYDISTTSGGTATMERIPIEYGEFYDLPRQITFQSGDEWFLLRSYFDEEKDEYSDVYDVYLLPFRSKDDFEAHPDFWMPMATAVHLGHIPVTAVGLDETRRRSIDARAIETWLSARGHSKMPGTGDMSGAQ
jgi:hypothetical protein